MTPTPLDKLIAEAEKPICGYDHAHDLIRRLSAIVKRQRECIADLPEVAEFDSYRWDRKDWREVSNCIADVERIAGGKDD